MNKVDKNWISILDTWQNIIIRDNKFGDYHQMKIENPENNPVKCLFHENYITIPHENSLNFGYLHCDIRKVYFNKSCSCDLNWLTNITTENHINKESYCNLDNVSLESCLNTALYNVETFSKTICNPNDKIINCLKEKLHKKIDDAFINVNGDQYSIIDTKFWLIICTIIFLLIIIIIIIVCVIVRKVRKSKTIVSSQCETNTAVRFKNNDQQTFIFNTIKRSKSFSIHDRMIIDQTLENLKRKYSPDQYELVQDYTRKLLKGNLIESERIFTIGEIVKNVKECQESGEDFVAFNDILYRHLAPTDVNAVYSQPLNEIYVSPSIINIYTEPLHQPLLLNDTDLYSDPIWQGTINKRNL